MPRWWGWGSLDESYSAEEHPGLGPFLSAHLGPPSHEFPEPALESVSLPTPTAPNLSQEFSCLLREGDIRVDRLSEEWEQVESDQRMAELVWTYRACSWAVIRRKLENPGQAAPLSPGSSYPWACVDQAIEEEMVQTVSDVLVRCTRTVLEADNGGLQAAVEVAEKLAGHHGWTVGKQDRQPAQFGDEFRRAHSSRRGDPLLVSPLNSG